LTAEYKWKQGGVFSLNVLSAGRCNGKSSFMKSLTFRDFIDLLRTAGELHAVSAEVDPDLEIAALTDRVCKSRRNRALLFDSVKGSDFRVGTNLFGSEPRMALALGVESLPALTDRFDSFLAGLPGTNAAEKLASLTAAPCWSAAAPRPSPLPAYLHEAPLDLDRLPIIKSHPRDGEPVHAGRFLTLPLVITADPEGTSLNCGMYRAAPTAADRLAIAWSSSSGAALHAAAWSAHGEPMPVVIALGCAPALTFAATLPLPPSFDEFTFAGLLQGEPLRTFSCANGLAAPVDAEIVMEGYLQPGSTASGAFGNHSGFYTPSGPAAAVMITSIRLRRDMILPATVVGRPPMEDCWLARAGGYLLLSLLKIDVPEADSLHQPFAGIFHGAVFISVKNGAGRGPELMTAIRKTPWFTAAKLLVVVDAGQDPADEAGVLWRIMNSVNWAEDMVISGKTLSIDATGKASETRAAVKPDAGIMALVEKRWKEYGFES
jgi:4-hydroxy-3-polyprenylbenzoate decarboxylase